MPKSIALKIGLSHSAQEGKGELCHLQTCYEYLSCEVQNRHSGVSPSP